VDLVALAWRTIRHAVENREGSFRAPTLTPKPDSTGGLLGDERLESD
jgi:hypothetical protein